MLRACIVQGSDKSIPLPKGRGLLSKITAVAPQLVSPNGFSLPHVMAMSGEYIPSIGSHEIEILAYESCFVPFEVFFTFFYFTSSVMCCFDFRTLPVD